MNYSKNKKMNRRKNCKSKNLIRNKSRKKSLKKKRGGGELDKNITSSPPNITPVHQSNRNTNRNTYRNTYRNTNRNTNDMEFFKILKEKIHSEEFKKLGYLERPKISDEKYQYNWLERHHTQVHDEYKKYYNNQNEKLNDALNTEKKPTQTKFS